jgi:hypothetical protein
MTTFELDRMKREDLLAFWAKYNRPTRKQAEELFGSKFPGCVRAAKNLANYAANRAAEKYCHANKDKVGSSIYEKICGNIRSKF